MNKPYNNYIMDRIESFSLLIFKYGYNDYELRDSYIAYQNDIQNARDKNLITEFEYHTIISIMATLYNYVCDVCNDIRFKEKLFDKK